jgi:hypothetical protein
VAFFADTLARADRRVDALIERFEHFVEVFDREPRFCGPSVYFHDRALKHLHQFRSPSETLLDDAFIESIYAVLTAWGMHPMGSRGARMAEFDVFRDSLRAQTPRIEALKRYANGGGGLRLKLAEIPGAQIPHLSEDLWSIVQDLELGMSDKARIVIGSKALHHLLPELVPPIDRRYTLRFFLGVGAITAEREPGAFHEIFPRFHRIAVGCNSTIERLMNEGIPEKRYMRTSSTKMIDNAIVGFGIERLKIGAED